MISLVEAAEGYGGGGGGGGGRGGSAMVTPLPSSCVVDTPGIYK